jgi:hypothetical protein
MFFGSGSVEYIPSDKMLLSIHNHGHYVTTITKISGVEGEVRCALWFSRGDFCHVVGWSGGGVVMWWCGDVVGCGHVVVWSCGRVWSGGRVVWCGRVVGGHVVGCGHLVRCGC